MTEIRLRQRLEETYGPLDFSAGLKLAWRSIQPNRTRSAFPHQSVHRLVHALRWPAPDSFHQLSSHPRNRRTAWSDELQGVTHDETHWFITHQNKSSSGTANKLWRIPIAVDLDQDFDPVPVSVLVRGMPDELSNDYNHFSDLDYYNGQLYMAIEGDGVPGIVAQFDAQDLRFRGFGILSGQDTSAPWCAVNAQTGHIYSSRFDTSQVHIYGPLQDGQGNLAELEHLGDLSLLNSAGNPITIRSVQGGTFAPSGHLYLVSDRHNGGIIGFDAVSGHRRVHIDIRHGLFREYEGLTYWNVNHLNAPGIRGTLHLLEMAQRKLQTDKVIFRHFDVPGEDREFI